jgi:hypothetical protein
VHFSLSLFIFFFSLKKKKLFLKFFIDYISIRRWKADNFVLSSLLLIVAVESFPVYVVFLD